MSGKDMDATIQTIRSLQCTIEELTAELEAAKDAIKAEMVEQGREELTGNGWKAADPSTYARYTVATRTSRFTIS